MFTGDNDDLEPGEGAAFECPDCQGRVAVKASRVETAAVRCVGCDEPMDPVERR